MTRNGKVTKTIGLVGGLAMVALGVAAGTGWSSPPARNGVEYGTAVPMGDGTARVYIELRDGVPLELGVALSERALDGLPTHHSPGGIELEPGHMMFFSTPEMPRTNPTPYRHVFLGWNPGGHAPPGVYDLPHFDFHLYLTENAEREAIHPATDPEFERKAANHPSAEYAPQGYVAIPGGVPLMGSHWVDPTTPELNGEVFTKTFLFGSWDGELTFAEPMITRAYLETRPDYYQRIPLPEKQAQAGWYPTGYRIRWVEELREYHIALTDFVWRDAAVN